MSFCVLVFWGCSRPLSDPSRGSPRATSDRLPPLRGEQTKGGAVLIPRATRAPPNEAADLPVQTSYKDADETLARNGYAPNREAGQKGLFQHD